MASMCYVIRGGPVPEVALMAQGLHATCDGSAWHAGSGAEAYCAASVTSMVYDADLSRIE